MTVRERRRVCLRSPSSLREVLVVVNIGFGWWGKKEQQKF